MIDTLFQNRIFLPKTLIPPNSRDGFTIFRKKRFLIASKILFL